MGFFTFTYQFTHCHTFSDSDEELINIPGDPTFWLCASLIGWDSRSWLRNSRRDYFCAAARIFTELSLQMSLRCLWSKFPIKEKCSNCSFEPAVFNFVTGVFAILGKRSLYSPNVKPDLSFLLLLTGHQQLSPCCWCCSYTDKSSILPCVKSQSCSLWPI